VDHIYFKNQSRLVTEKKRRQEPENMPNYVFECNKFLVGINLNYLLSRGRKRQQNSSHSNRVFEFVAVHLVFWEKYKS